MNPDVLPERIGREERALYSRVAYAYYTGGLTQEQIAQRMRMSRQRVNRILKKSLDLGIVEIRIHQDPSAFLAQESALEEKFNLRAVRLIETSGHEDDRLAELGQCAADYLHETLRDGDVIGFSRGRTLAATVDHLRPASYRDMTVTQLMGGWNRAMEGSSGDSIVRRFGEKIPAKVNMLYAPVLVKDATVRQGILQEPYYRDSYQIIKTTTIAVLGIAGMTSFQFPRLEEVRKALPPAAVGEVCGHFYDLAGRPVASELDEKIMAIEYDDLMQIPLRIGVAGLADKFEAILGALRGGYINALITDTDVAADLLAG